MPDIDRRQRALDPVKHARFGGVFEALPAFAAQRFAVLGHKVSRGINQILALIIISRQLNIVAQLLLITQHQALSQLDHLRARVVVIVFALHRVASRIQQARHGIADDSAARMPDGDGSAGVGADELDLRPLPAADIQLKSASPSAIITSTCCLRNSSAMKQLMNPGGATVSSQAKSNSRSIAYNQVGDIEWLFARELRQAHRRIRKVALAGAFRGADRDAWNRKRRQLAGILRLANGVFKSFFQFFVQQLQLAISPA